MKRAIGLTLGIACVLWLGAGNAQGAPQTWAGMISDSQCGGDHGGEVDPRECTLKCAGQNYKYVLVVDRGTKVMSIANQDFAGLPDHAGHTVKVTGELKDDAIVVSKIEM